MLEHFCPRRNFAAYVIPIRQDNRFSEAGYKECEKCSAIPRDHESHCNENEDGAETCEQIDKKGAAMCKEQSGNGVLSKDAGRQLFWDRLHYVTSKQQGICDERSTCDGRRTYSNRRKATTTGRPSCIFHLDYLFLPLTLFLANFTIQHR